MPQSSQAAPNAQTVYIGDLPKDISMVELYEYIRAVAGECELVVKRYVFLLFKEFALDRT